MALDKYRNGILIERADDIARTVTFYGPTGAVTGSRPYTAAENTAADLAVAAASARLAREATRTAVKAIIVDLVAEKDRVDLVIAKANNAISGADTKDVARAAKRIADAAIDLSRLVQDLP